MNFLRYIVILVTLSTPIIRQKDAFTDNAQSRNITQLLPCQNYDKFMPNSSLVETNLMFANDLQLNSYTMLFYHVKHSRINPPSVPVEFKQRIHRLLIILVISGDISHNPGPVKNPCGLCAKPVAKNYRAVLCEGCNYWWHIKCGKLTPEQYKTLRNSNDPWICHDCSYFKFSDFFFDGSIPSTDNDENSSDDDHDIFENLTETRRHHPKRVICAYLNINSLMLKV